MRSALRRLLKTAFCFFLGIIIPIQFAQAQEIDRKIRWGIMIGDTYSFADVSKSNFPAGLEFEESRKHSPSFGIRANIPLTSQFGIHTGISYKILSYRITQTTLGNDSLTGFINTTPQIESWEIPVILSYNLPFKNNLLKNFYVAGGLGFALDHYKSVHTFTNFDVAPALKASGWSVNNTPEFFDELVETGNVFAPTLIVGIGTNVNISSRRSLQLNAWYAKGIKQQDQLNTKTTLLSRYEYPLEIKALVSGFRFEVVYFPWKQ